MSRYRELVQHRLAVHHAGIEMRLARAREQEAFVLQVERKLSAGGWDYRMGMTPNFGVVFTVFLRRLPSDGQFQAVREALLACGEVECEMAGNQRQLHVSNRAEPGIGCRVVFDGDEYGC